MLAFVLVFLRKFDDLSALPVAYTSMIIVIVAGGPGKTIGACVQGVVLGLGGVVLGAGFFAILAKLGNFPVAQAIIFAVIVYCEFSPYFVLSTAEPQRAPIPGSYCASILRPTLSIRQFVCQFKMFHLRMPMTSFASSRPN